MPRRVIDRRMLSVIIPTLNEAEHLPATVARLRRAARGQPFELIVSDCDSPDDTAAVARRAGVDAVTGGGACRSDALNRGAAASTGDILLFLHADTDLPSDFVSRVQRALRCPQVVGGAFEFAFLPNAGLAWVDRRSLGLVVFCNRFRYRYGRGFFGDQGIFCRRATFERLGGFPTLPLLEDLKFSQAMARLGRTAILNPPALTSPRRFVRHGVLRQFARDWLILAHDSFGLTPRAMWNSYNEHNRLREAVALRPAPRRSV